MKIFTEKFSIEEYSHIPSIKHRKDIQKVILNINNLPIDLFVLCIEYGGRTVFLGNYPTGVIIPYNFPFVKGADPVFMIAKSTHIFNFSTLQYEAEINKTLREIFNVNNYFSLSFPMNHICITAIFSGNQQKTSFEINHIIKRDDNKIKNFIYNFIENTKSIIYGVLPPLKYLEIFRDKIYLKKLIFGHLDDFVQLITDKEIELLFWYKTGRSEYEISQITHYKPSSIKTFLKRIREKLGAGNTREAVYFAEKSGYIL